VATCCTARGWESGSAKRWRATITVNEPTHLKNEMYIFMVVQTSLPEVSFSASEL
jgi:hypothetical protein